MLIVCIDAWTVMITLLQHNWCQQILNTESSWKSLKLSSKNWTPGLISWLFASLQSKAWKRVKLSQPLLVATVCGAEVMRFTFFTPLGLLASRVISFNQHNLYTFTQPGLNIILSNISSQMKKLSWYERLKKFPRINRFDKLKTLYFQVK